MFPRFFFTSGRYLSRNGQRRGVSGPVSLEDRIVTLEKRQESMSKHATDLAFITEGLFLMAWYGSWYTFVNYIDNKKQ
jgi:hypothetical protein